MDVEPGETCPALTRVQNTQSSPVLRVPTVCQSFAHGKNDQNCFPRPQAPAAGLGDLALRLPATHVPGLSARSGPTPRPLLLLSPPPAAFCLWARAHPLPSCGSLPGGHGLGRPPGPQAHPLWGLISLPNTWHIYIPHVLCEPWGGDFLSVSTPAVPVTVPAGGQCSVHVGQVTGGSVSWENGP